MPLAFDLQKLNAIKQKQNTKSKKNNKTLI